MSNPSTSAQAQITFAGVADKALDKISDGMGNLVNDAEKISSEIISRIDHVAPQMISEIRKTTYYAWECLIRQKRAEGIFYILAAIAIPFIVYLWNKYIIVKMFKSNDLEAVGWGWFFLIAFWLAATILTPILLYYGLSYLISPEYYAVLDLIEKFK